MELRALAEQVLFATTLEEKLRCPDAITDAHPGAAMPAPAVPGRPASLRFKTGGEAGAGFPASRLEDERERGRLLHFFANHELLATELMALVLLRFPEAPAAFRRGVLQTLRDEQEHTRLYLERMRACGIEFGELPVSGYFWRALAGMENPIDYVAGLSLTFEQANLDFARHFAADFSRVGDDASAALLEKIYRDEIGHVAYGLKWFRRWKNPEESDWTAFCRQLKYPLSPQRAKGFQVNVEGRRAAGLDPEFIAELDVYSRSKGRTPGVFVFNPFAEGYIANGPGFSPVKRQAELALDLASLPQFLCRQDDIVLVPKRPPVQFLAGLKEAGFALPEFVETGEKPALAVQNLARRRIGFLRPWAWSPDSVALLHPLEAALPGHAAATAPRFHAGLAELYSKAWSVKFLRALLADAEPAPWLCGESAVGAATETLDATLAAVDRIRARGHHRVVVKEALGLAGSNAIRLWEPAILPNQRQWMENRLAEGTTLIVEPWLERVLDFSAQYEMGPTGLRLVGYTTLLIDARGQYLGNRAAPNHARHPPAEIAPLLATPADVAVRLRALFDQIRRRLEAALAERGASGPIGVDAFVYRDASGCRVKPVVEINPRYTMGRVALELMRQACPGSHGLFQILHRRHLERGSDRDFAVWAEALRARHPLQLEGRPVRRIRSGAVILNDPAEARAGLALFVVGSEAGPTDLTL